MSFDRQLLEGAIKRLIDLLDEIDGDPDFEPEPPEEQHDAEADITWANGIAPNWFVMAERARGKASRKH